MTAPCTFYLTLASHGDFVELVRKHFSGWKLREDDAVVTASKRWLLFRREVVFGLKSQDADGEEFSQMMRGMFGLFNSVSTEREDIRDAVLHHIRAFTVAVSVTKLDRTLFMKVLSLVQDGHGLMFLPPASLYNGRGELVFNAKGESGVNCHIVTAPAALLDQQIHITDSGEARKARSNDLLAFQGVPLCRSLPSIVADEDCTLRSVDEVVGRTLSLLVMAVHAEMIRDRGAEQAAKSIGELLDQFQVRPFLSPEERAFVEAAAPEEQMVLTFVWRYECAWTGLWALGLVPDFAYPDSICDVGIMVSLVKECGDMEGVRARATLLSATKILDEADKMYRYDWACVDAEVKNVDAPANLASGVVQERHRMLNWLICYQNAEWDDVRTDT